MVSLMAFVGILILWFLIVFILVYPFVFKKVNANILPKMEIVDYFDVYMYDSFVTFTLRKWKGEFYLFMSKENEGAEFLGKW